MCRITADRLIGTNHKQLVMVPCHGCRSNSPDRNTNLICVLVFKDRDLIIRTAGKQAVVVVKYRIAGTGGIRINGINDRCFTCFQIDDGAASLFGGRIIQGGKQAVPVRGDRNDRHRKLNTSHKVRKSARKDHLRLDSFHGDLSALAGSGIVVEYGVVLFGRDRVDRSLMEDKRIKPVFGQIVVLKI